MALAEQLGTFTTLVGGPEYVHCLLVSLEDGRPGSGEGECRVGHELPAWHSWALHTHSSPASPQWLFSNSRNTVVYLTISWALG